MITLINERGETVPYPPEGLTIRELLQSFGDCRLAFLTDAMAGDKAVQEPEAATLRTEELNGLLPETEVREYVLVQNATYDSTIISFSARLTTGTATLALRVGGETLFTYAASSASAVLVVEKTLLSGKSLVLAVTAASSPGELAFTVGFQR